MSSAPKVLSARWTKNLLLSQINIILFISTYFADSKYEQSLSLSPRPSLFI